MRFVKSWKDFNRLNRRVKDYVLILIICNIFVGVSIAQSNTAQKQEMIDSSQSELINVFLDFDGDRQEYIIKIFNMFKG